jgi:hypothetical protein
MPEQGKIAAASQSLGMSSMLPTHYAAKHGVR